jgi:hypothetical protein
LAETKIKMLLVTAVILVTVLVCSSVTVVWWQSVDGYSGLRLRTQSTAYTSQPHWNQSFTVTANVDLSDGMNRTEAASVAMGVFSHVLENAACTIKSATSNAEGIWTVNLSWSGNQELPSHLFGVEINPANQTATYSRCY